MFTRMIESISSLSGWLAQWASYAMMILTTVDVGLRYVLRKHLLWTDEVSIYLMLCIAFIGAAATMKAGRHIRVDLVWIFLPQKTRLWLNAITAFITCIVLCIVFWYTSLWVYQSYVTKWTAPSVLLTPFWIPQLVMPIGLFFLLAQCLLGLSKSLKALRTDDMTTDGGCLPE